MVGKVTMQTANIPSLSILTFPRMGAGKLLLPVRPSATLLAGFKHITVIPDPSREGIPLYKLNALDSLLDGLAGSSEEASGMEVRADSIDSIMSIVSSKVLSRASSPFGAGLLPDAGGVVDMVA